MSIINTLWKLERCPLRTGIYGPDDTVIWLEVSMQRACRNGEWVRADIIGSGKLERGIDGSLGITTDLIQTNECVYPELDLRISSGEGGHGPEGFIAVMDDAELDEKLMKDLGCDYYPFDADVSAREWLSHVAAMFIENDKHS